MSDAWLQWEPDADMFTEEWLNSLCSDPTLNGQFQATSLVSVITAWGDSFVLTLEGLVRELQCGSVRLRDGFTACYIDCIQLGCNIDPNTNRCFKVGEGPGGHIIGKARPHPGELLRIANTWTETTGLEPPPHVRTELTGVMDLSRPFRLRIHPMSKKSTVTPPDLIPVRQQDLKIGVGRKWTFFEPSWICACLLFAHEFIVDWLQVNPQTNRTAASIEHSIRVTLCDLYRQGVDKVAHRSEPIRYQLLELRNEPMIATSLSRRHREQAGGEKGRATRTKAKDEHLRELRRLLLAIRKAHPKASQEWVRSRLIAAYLPKHGKNQPSKKVGKSTIYRYFANGDLAIPE